MKKLQITVVAAAFTMLSLAALPGCSGRDSGTAAPKAAAVGVSALKANPDKYLGQLVINGKASNVFPDDGVIEISDDKACCSIYLFVPFNREQQAKLKIEQIYDGRLPAAGAAISARGELSKSDAGYRFTVSEITEGANVIVAMK